MLQESDLEALPDDFEFTETNFPPLFFNRSSRRTMAKLATRIAWAKKWLSCRRDREGIHVSDLTLTTVVSAFNNLSNQQLQMWTVKQEEKLKLLNAKSANDLKEPTELCQEELSPLLTLSDISGLHPNCHFIHEMFPTDFLVLILCLSYRHRKHFFRLELLVT